MASRSDSRGPAANPGYWKVLGLSGGAAVIYVRKVQEYDLLTCVHKARNSIRYKGNLPKIPDDEKDKYYKLIRYAADSCSPDGDALNAFQRSCTPTGLVIRLIPAPNSKTYEARTTKIPKLIVTTQSRREEYLLGLLKRRGCSVSEAGRTPKPKPVWYRPPEEEVLIPVAIPADNDLKEAVADLVGEFNIAQGLQIKSEELAPYLVATVVPVAAAVTIQSSWRGLRARLLIDPPVSTRLIRRRAAMCLQRWWKTLLFKLRFTQLETLRRQMRMLQRLESCDVVMTVGSYRRMIQLAEDRASGRGFPRITPEHNLRFTFDKMDKVVAISSTPGVLRSVPLWTGIEVPVIHDDDATKIYGAADLKYLLFKGTKMQELGPPPERAAKFLATDYMMKLTYATPLEAQRRLAVFVALSFDLGRQSQLVTLLPSPLSLDRKNPASIPGMGLTDASQKLGTLEEMVKEVLPKTSPLWNYVLDMLAPEVVKEQRELPTYTSNQLAELTMSARIRPAEEALYKHKSMFMNEPVVLPPLEEIVEQRERTRGLLPPMLTKMKTEQTRFLGPLRTTSREPGQILIPTIPTDTSREMSFTGFLVDQDAGGLPVAEEYRESLYSQIHSQTKGLGKHVSEKNMDGVTLARLDSLPGPGDGFEEYEGDVSLAESMGLTRKLMANLQRVETAENEAAIKFNLRAELLLRQEQVDMVRASKGTSIRKYWKTTAPLSVGMGLTLHESTLLARTTADLCAKDARTLVQDMRSEHGEIVRAYRKAKAAALQGISQLALHQQTTILKEVDKRRMADEEINKRKVQFRKERQQRARMMQRERKFAQAFQRQHNVLNRQIVNAELRYRDVVGVEEKIDVVESLREEADQRREVIRADLESRRRAKREETLKFHQKCKVAIARNKQERATINDIVDKRRTEIRAGMAMVGPAGGLWGARRPETYRATLNMTSVSSAAEYDRRGALGTGSETSFEEDLSSVATGIQDSTTRSLRGQSSGDVSRQGARSNPELVKTEKTEAEWAAELDGESAEMLFMDGDDCVMFPDGPILTVSHEL